MQSGTPLTARVLSPAADVARGTNGTLRANYDGDPIELANPTIDQFFNTSAFSIPAAGQFGNAGTEPDHRPGEPAAERAVRTRRPHGQQRTVTLQLNATNLLNMVNYATVDSAVNSPTFGEVLSVRPMRSMQFTMRFRF